MATRSPCWTRRDFAKELEKTENELHEISEKYPCFFYFHSSFSFVLFLLFPLYFFVN